MGWMRHQGRERESAGTVPSEDRLRLQARAREVVASWVPLPTEHRSPIPLLRAYRSANDRLNAALKSHARTAALADTAAWLTENARLLRTSLLQVCDALRSFEERVWVRDGEGREVPRAYAAAEAYRLEAGNVFGEVSFVEFTQAAQEAGSLEMGELWALKPMLQLCLLEELARLEPGSLPACINSLRAIGEADWKAYFDAVSVVEQVLRRDPAGAYGAMDDESRDLYRTEVARLAAHSRCDEREVAESAVGLARAAREQPIDDLRRWERRGHVGYYLLDQGLASLRAAVGYRLPLPQRVREFVVDNGTEFYVGGIELLTFLIVLFLLSELPVMKEGLLSLLVLALPASQGAVELMNSLATFLLPPRRLPKLDLSAGIPDDCPTLVAVPTLLLAEHQVRGLVEDLEIRYLANRDPNLAFALLTDSPDSAQPIDEKDELVALAIRLIEGLNSRHGVRGVGPFHLLHRHRVFNPSENTWMGWERKRGKLMDLNQLLRDDHDSFPVKVGDAAALRRVRYVITLDSDTQLPRDAAKRLVGTLAHPLHRAVIDPATNMVVEGYGILQPRVGVSVQSAGRSRLASLYSGQTGFDIYTRAVSDVYQDLFAEGIFTGKGIYEVDALRAVLDDRFPQNALLSHDLIEGAYARAALASDVEVIDDYPSHFSAYSRRKHRWVRGDWQIMRWLLPRVPDAEGRPVRNPISLLSRWKIVDNLRRSLVDPATLLLFLAGWLLLPGGPLYWTLASVALLLVPVYAQFLFALLRAPFVSRPLLHARDAAGAFAQGHVTVLLSLTFLFHQALLSADAIVRTMVRQTITRRRMLEWETAAQAEVGKGKRTPVDLYLSLTPFLSLGIALALAFRDPEALLVAAPVLLLWVLSKPISRWLDQPPRVPRREVRLSDVRFLRSGALRTWHYFRDFATAGENALVPDNVQESPARVAHRLSPTNLGLLLNARQAAVEMGYLTVPEFVAETRRTLDAALRLPRHAGHFLNWYDTQTLQPLQPLFVSSVDSGNLAGSLWTLKQGCLAMARKPLLGPAVWQGLLDHARLWCEEEPSAIPRLRRMEALGNDAASWESALPSLLAEVRPVPEGTDTGAEASVPSGTGRLRLVERLHAVASLVDTWGAATLSPTASLDSLRGNGGPGGERADSLCSDLQHMAQLCERLVAEMDFRLVYDPKRKLLSVGYDVSEGRRLSSCYDLLASEARMASFVAIAKGDIPQESWFHLGRAHTLHEGSRALLSWTGTMFEYLMPALWMQSHPGTLLDQGMRAALRVQQQHGRRHHRPWGVSEAAHHETDEAGNYQYLAFGLRALALKAGVPPPLVVAPYATFLALPLDPQASVANLRTMAEQGWSGAYGFYESADYSASRNGEVVRCWMAHHQGMSLLAVANLLLDSPFVRLFHSEPHVLATELLLQEKSPRGLTAEPAPEQAPEPSLVSALAE